MGLGSVIVGSVIGQGIGHAISAKIDRNELKKSINRVDVVNEAIKTLPAKDDPNHFSSLLNACQQVHVHSKPGYDLSQYTQDIAVVESKLEEIPKTKEHQESQKTATEKMMLSGAVFFTACRDPNIVKEIAALDAAQSEKLAENKSKSMMKTLMQNSQ